MALILYWKGDHALRQDHRKTELWLMLAENRRPPHDVAAVVVPRILRCIYHEHCRLALTAACGLALPAFGLRLLA